MMTKDRKQSKAPKKKYNSYKVSDRRMAAAFRPNKYLHSQQTAIIDPNLERIKTTKKGSNGNDELSKIAVARHDPRTGRIWHDKTLTEWDPSHYRLFVGNIGNDVDEDLLINTFIEYPSLSKVKIPRDDVKGENKGFAFISFADADDYLKCYRQKNGKYIGSKPVSLERAKTEIGDVVAVNNKKNTKNNRKGRR